MFNVKNYWVLPMRALVANMRDRLRTSYADIESWTTDGTASLVNKTGSEDCAKALATILRGYRELELALLPDCPEVFEATSSNQSTGERSVRTSYPIGYKEPEQT